MSQKLENGKKVGAVMVIGGGIAGVQSALDLAESGFKVYLVERNSSIGGVMAQLDKTFPTNDCSMCILSPKLVDCGRHLNIQLLTKTDIQEVSGEAGNFTVKVRRRARYIDLEKCTGCGDCVDVCPIKNVPDSFNRNLSRRSPIFRSYPQAVPGAFLIDKRGPAPCKAACPIGQDVPGYIAMIREGKFAEAVEIIRRTNPLPLICGYACFHPCELACERHNVDEPVSIRNLKRFAMDWAVKNNLDTPPPVPAEKRDEKVAIIGSGPAGLSVAYHLAKQGYRPTVIEAYSVIGGMLAVGLPTYRLPRNVLKYDVDYIEKLGVEFKTGVRVGKDVTIPELQQQGYDAVVLATGTQQGTKMGVPGEDLPGVVQGMELLGKFNLGEKIDIGKRVSIIGGGNTAIDTARTAWRLGADVTVFYRRSEQEMPADEEELHAAMEEGVKFEYLTAPVEFNAGEDGSVASMTCIRMELGEPDASGRRRPLPIKGSEYTVETDFVVLAIGLKPRPDFAAGADELKLERWDGPVVDPDSYETSIPGVFAAGDVVTGPTNIVEALRRGRDVAIVVDAYLSGKEYKGIVEARIDPATLRREHFINPNWELDYTNVTRAPRIQTSRISVEERRKKWDLMEHGFTEEQAKEEASRCLECGVCVECWECVKACGRDAIFHDMVDTFEDITVGSIIVAPGFSDFQAATKDEYGYGHLENVVTSIEFERMMSASGPMEGHIRRPSDGKSPRKVAFIQCVGSRDVKRGNDYCSSVCCMYAIKEAIIAKEHDKNIEPTIFFMDIRAFGKDFEKYYNRAEEEYGIGFIRSRIPAVEEDLKTKDLILRYETEDGEFHKEKFDLVVLSIGLVPPPFVHELKDRLGIDLNSYGFCKTRDFHPLSTSREGIYACGAFSGPKDIPESVMEASAAAAKAGALLADARGTLTTEKEYPPERDIRGEPPRIGVFVCRCGINIGGVVDVPAVVEAARELDFVVLAEENTYTCSADALQNIAQKIKEHNLNRVVVASCSPRTHEPLFRDTLAEAGLNPYLFEMANIRDQCSWVHMNDPHGATEKAKDLVRMAVAKSRLLMPLYKHKLPVTKRGLIIGGGLAGMTAALAMAENGFDTYIVEKNNRLGGRMHDIYFTLDGEDTRKVLNNIIEQVEQHERITAYLNSTIQGIDGCIGNFKTTVVSNGSELELEHGVVIVATGALEYSPHEFLYDKSERVITQSELELKLVEKSPLGESVVMIQCVGSRNEENPNCSRVCCQEAVKNALKIKELYPDTEVVVLYRDMRTFGYSEKKYRQARQKGVIFIRYDLDHEPHVAERDGRMIVRVYEPLLKEEIELDADHVVLSVGTVANPGNTEIAKMLKVPLTAEGFFLEAHMKLRPVDFATDGVFLCGMAHSPKLMDESIAQAEAAASRACTILSKEYILAEGTTAHVNSSKCALCGTCVEVCPFKAASFSEDGSRIEINEVLCKGCGTCAASCRCGAIDLYGFLDTQINEMVESAMLELEL